MSKYILSVRILMRQEEPYQSGGLELSESVEISVDTFLEMASILGKFHELAQLLKSEREKKK